MGLTDKIFKGGRFELETTTDGSVDKIDGDCLFRNITGGFEFMYKEPICDTKIRLTTDRVELERKGELSYRFIVEPEKTHEAVMNTPYGKMDVAVTGEDMLYMPTAQGFDAVLRYFIGAKGDEKQSHIVIALRVKFTK